MLRSNLKTEELVRAGRAALRPTDADRERVFHALQARLGGNLAPDAIERLSTTPAKASLGFTKLAAVLVGMSVAGGGMFALLRIKPVPASASTTSVSEVAPEVPGDETPQIAPSTVPQTQPVDEKRATTAPRSTDSLAKEVAMLSQASADLHAGRPAAALSVLDEHQRKFPHGGLVQERTSARIQALCALGRVTEAQAEVTRLARTSPNSLHLARARKACGFGPTQ